MVDVRGVAGQEVQNPEAALDLIDHNLSSDHSKSRTNIPPAASLLVSAQRGTGPFIVRRLMKPECIWRHLDARRLRQSWMARIQDDFVLKPGRSIPRRGVLDRSSFKWEMTPNQAPDEYRGIDEDSVQTLKYVPNDDWLFEDVAGVRAPLDYASISRLGKIVRPLLRSDNGPTPAAGERLFVIENPKPLDPNWTVPLPPPPPPPPRSAESPNSGYLEEWNDAMMKQAAAIQAETRRKKAEKKNAALEAIGKAAALAKVNAARANAGKRNAEKRSGSATAAPALPFISTLKVGFLYPLLITRKPRLIKNRTRW